LNVQESQETVITSGDLAAASVPASQLMYGC